MSRRGTTRTSQASIPSRMLSGALFLFLFAVGNSARAQDREDEIVANLAGGRVIVHVAKDEIIFAAIDQPVEPTPFLPAWQASTPRTLRCCLELPNGASRPTPSPSASTAIFSGSAEEKLATILPPEKPSPTSNSSAPPSSRSCVP